MDDFLAKPEDEEKASPINYISGEEDIPVLCLHGGRDPLVEKENSFSFVEKLNSQGKDNGEVKIIEEAYHSNLIELFFRNNKYKESKMLIDWLEERM